MNNNLIQALENASLTLPRQQRKLCEYIQNNLLEASMLTIPQMAKKSGTATATVVRTIQSLGYPNYSQFKAELKKSALVHVGSSYASYVKGRELSQNNNPQGANIANLLRICEHTIHNMESQDFISLLLRAVDMLYHAKCIYTLALRSSECIASGFECLLHNAAIPVVQLHTKGERIYDCVLQITAMDVLLLCAASPVTRKTVEVARICHDRGIPVILVTNNSEASVCQYATILINPFPHADESSPITLSATPMFLVMESLSGELSRRYAEHSSVDAAEQLDKLARDYQLPIWDWEHEKHSEL